MTFLKFLAFVLFIWKVSMVSFGLAGGTSNVKIVEAPVVSRAYVSSWNQPKKLNLRIPPANYSGPPALRSFDGRCFSMVEKNYKYEFCPFQNVTQHEQSTRWNSYKGVLGVFQGWEIVNGSLSAMLFMEGDGCESKHRQCKVMFTCGVEEKLTSASEPTTCHYELVFTTPVACNSSVFAVYYLLNSTLQAKWREVQELFYHQEITFKGVNKRMDDIHRAANLTPNYVVPSEETKNTLKSSPSFYSSQSKFSSVYICEKAHDDLEERIKQLETELKELRLRYNITSNNTLQNSTTNATLVNSTAAQLNQMKNSTVAMSQHGENDSKGRPASDPALPIKPGEDKAEELVSKVGKVSRLAKEEYEHTSSENHHHLKHGHEQRDKGATDTHLAQGKVKVENAQVVHHRLRSQYPKKMHSSHARDQHHNRNHAQINSHFKGSQRRHAPKRVVRSHRQENRQSREQVEDQEINRRHSRRTRLKNL